MKSLWHQKENCFHSVFENVALCAHSSGCFKVKKTLCETNNVLQ